MLTRLVATVLVSAALQATASAQAESRAGMTPVTHVYRNEQFGFTVPLLVGIHAFRDEAPAPNHGLLYELGDARNISVSASFDAADYGSSQALIERRLAANSAPSAAIVLAGKPAQRVVTRSGDKVSVLVVQRRGEDGGIFYELTLDSDRPHEAEDTAKFEKVLRAFRTIPLRR
jgi:hypothetical protein